MSYTADQTPDTDKSWRAAMHHPVYKRDSIKQRVSVNQSHKERSTRRSHVEEFMQKPPY